MTDSPVSGTPPTDLRQQVFGDFADRAITRTYPKNTIVVSENDRTDSFYLILSGRVKIFVSDENGREVVLGVEGPGDYFGEMVLDDGPRSASVITTEPTTLSVLPKDEFREMLRSNPDFAIELIRKLIGRTRVLTDNVKSLALLDVYGRVARLLLQLATEENGRLVIAEKLTQQDIADRVGASREMISRIFKDLTAGGYITVEGRIITINKKPPRRW